MTIPLGLPDVLSQSRLSRAQADTKRGLDQAQQELVSGEAADRFKATGGDPARLMAMERSVATLDSRAPLIAMAAGRAAGTQTSLEGVHKATEGMGVKLLQNIDNGEMQVARFTAADAKVALEQVMGALNTQLGGRHLFAGAKAGAPLASADALLTDMRAIFTTTTPGGTAPTAADIQTRLDDYFAGKPPLPNNRSFDNIYQGSQNPPPPVELADGEYLHYAQRADAPALRDMMRGLATAAMSAELLTGTADRDKLTAMLDYSGKTLIKATDDVTQMRAELGAAESRIEQAQIRSSAQRATLERARADLIGRDQYESATRVTELQSQLEAIYALTARSTQLSLLNFLR